MTEREQWESEDQETSALTEAQLDAQLAEDGDLSAEQEREREAVLDTRRSKGFKFG